MVRRTAILALSAAAVTLTACGGDDANTTPVAGTTERAVATETTPVTTTTSGTTATETTTSATGTETADTGGAEAGEPDSSTGGASAEQDEGGDESGNNVPVVVTISGNGVVSPARITVPAFFKVMLTVRSLEAPAIVTVDRDGKPDLRFSVEPAGHATRTVGTLAPGTYKVQVQGGGTTVIRSVSGGAAGP